jgi:hypothetical protein
MMLVMLDILRNAPMVSLQDIVKRQHLLGSEIKKFFHVYVQL